MRFIPLNFGIKKVVGMGTGSPKIAASLQSNADTKLFSWRKDNTVLDKGEHDATAVSGLRDSWQS
jgi:hypothetical protein